MTRIALTFAGGGSLGAYTAGAAREILGALERGRGEGGGPRVAVVAGLSAGGIVAAVAARSLVRNPSLAPWLERMWVDGLDIGTLLNPERTDRSGLLDLGVLHELTRAMVTAEAASDDRSSAALGPELRVGIGLTDLAGLPVVRPGGGLGPGPSSRGFHVHRDWVEATLGREASADDPRWERLRRAAVASASVPLLFPTTLLAGDLRAGGPVEAAGRAGPRSGSPGGEAGGRAPEGTFPCAEGSLLGDGPLTLAKRLVERVPDHAASEWRYVLVNPWMRRGGEPRLRLPETGRAGPAAAGLLRALLGDGTARDWERAVEKNTRLEVLESLATHLPELSDRLTDPEAYALGRAIGELAERVAERKVAERPGTDAHPADPVLSYLDEHLSRIRSDPRYAPVLGRVETRAGRTRLAKLVFLLESLGGLRGRDRMPIHLVAPEAPEALAGDALGGFAGFLRREWRADDFRAGRRDARRVLEEELSGLLDYEPDDDEAYASGGVEVSFPAVPEASRRAVAAFARAEADRMLDETPTGLLASLLAWSWKPALRRRAEARALEVLRSAF